MSASRSHIIFLALGVAAFAVHAQGGIAGMAQTRRMPAYAEAMEFYMSNPATMCLADTVTLSQAEASARACDIDGVPQMGTARREASLGATSYRRLGLADAAWGRASFTAARTGDVRYANCIDYMRVAPYVLGDSVGGNLNSQRYEFGGGYSRLYDRWTFGADISYRAETAHRSVDPRVRDIVSDLSIGAGATWRASAAYRIGLSASINIYSQDCDLDFYNPLNDINTHAYTGLGTQYKRFEGNANKSSGYKSVGYGLCAILAPDSLAGPRLVAEYRAYRMPEQLRNFNNITLGYTTNHFASVAFACRIAARSAIVEPSASALCFVRIGTENIFGSAAGTGYEAIGKRSPYSRRIFAARASCLVQMTRGRHILAVKPSVSMVRDREAIASPDIASTDTRLAPCVDARYSATAGRWLLEAGGFCSYAFGPGRLAYGGRLAASIAAGACLPGVAVGISRSSLSASLTITL